MLLADLLCVYAFLHVVVCRIDESLCRVDDGTDTEEPTITYERCDTRASGKPAVPYTYTPNEV